MSNTCRYCGFPVSPQNNAVRVALRVRRILGQITPDEERTQLQNEEPVHLRPHYQPGGYTLLCDGSPSVFQYCGGPKDPRGAYQYDPEVAPTFAEAYRQLQSELDDTVPIPS